MPKAYYRHSQIVASITFLSRSREKVQLPFNAIHEDKWPEIESFFFSTKLSTEYLFCRKSTKRWHDLYQERFKNEKGAGRRVATSGAAPTRSARGGRARRRPSRAPGPRAPARPRPAARAPRGPRPRSSTGWPPAGLEKIEKK